MGLGNLSTYGVYRLGCALLSTENFRLVKALKSFVGCVKCPSTLGVRVFWAWPLIFLSFCYYKYNPTKDDLVYVPFHICGAGSSDQSPKRSMQAPLHEVEPLCICPRVHGVPVFLDFANRVVKLLDLCHFSQVGKDISVHFNLLSLTSKAYYFFLTCRSHFPISIYGLFVFLSIFLSTFRYFS